MLPLTSSSSTKAIIYITLLAAVEEFFAAMMVWHAQRNTETPTAGYIDTWTEGVKAEGTPLKDDYVAAILPNVALHRNLARVHAQLVFSPSVSLFYT